MNSKRGSSFGILLFCMAAIVIFGENILLDKKESGRDTVVQGMQQEDEIYAIENEKLLIYDTLAMEDIFTKEYALIQKDTCDEESLETEEVVVSQLSMKELEDMKEQERLEEQKVREEEAIEAIGRATVQMNVSANEAILMNATTKEVLYSKGGLDTIQPASTAKLLTAIVAVELSEEGEEFVVGSEIDLMAPDSSRAYLVKGQVLSLENILDALLLPSGNDAAYVIAANLGRKIAGDDSLKRKAAVEVFVDKMNEMAHEIGVVNSNFVTPDGYDADGQYTTAYDLGLVASKALEYDEILNSVKKEKARNILLSGHDVTWYNSNKLVKQGSGYYYKYAIGLKTGTSGEAGRCLISAAKNGEKLYVSVVMNASYEGRWQDSIDLLDYAIRN